MEHNAESGGVMLMSAVVNEKQASGRPVLYSSGSPGPEGPHGDMGRPVGLGARGSGGPRAGSFIFFGMPGGKVRENEFQTMGQNSGSETHFLPPVGLRHPWK